MSSPNNTLFNKIRESNRFVAENATSVKINQTAIEKFLDDLDIDLYKKNIQVVHWPLKFDSVLEEVNFIALVDLINFGSGFRKELHKASGRGAYDTICYGLLGMQLSNRKLNTEFLNGLTLSDIESYFNIPLSVEKEIQPAIRSLVPSDLRLLGELILKVLTDTGKILRNRGYDSLAHLVIDSLNPKGSNEPSQTAEVFIENMTSILPAFNDRATYKGQTVLIFKKIQLLAADLHRKFAETDPRFRFKDIDQLTVFTDNVLPCVLRTLGILELSEELAALVDSGKVLKPGDHEVELRVLAMVASDLVVERAKAKYSQSNPELAQLFTAVQLDYFLWTVGKDPRFRTVERHYTQETVFY